ncbi:MFS transporter [Alicyclobacillus fodiniaquatilis]|uniref:MFS transporter n=1 Tax=Alicyclobacillus fodiniaquatilis TaxID=1661150 RepID=A0ABW4JHP2_9BACL
MRKNSNLMLFVSGQTLSTFGDNVFLIALMWFTISTTRSHAALTWIVLAQTVPPIFGLFSGTFVDHWSKRRTMIVTDVLRSMICVGIFIVSACHHPSFLLLFCFVFLLTTTGTFFWAAQNSILPFVVTEDELSTATGLNQSASTTSQLIGTLFGGTLLAVVGAPLLFLANAITFIVSCTTLGFLKVTEHSIIKNNKFNFWVRWREGINFITLNAYVLFVVISALIANFTLAPLDMALVTWVKGWTSHGTASTVAVISVGDVIGVLVGGLLVGPLAKQFSSRTLLLVSNFCVAACIGVLSLLSNVIWAVFWVFLMELQWVLLMFQS